MSRDKMTVYAIIGALAVVAATLLALYFFDSSRNVPPVLLPSPTVSGGPVLSPGPSENQGQYPRVRVTAETVQTAIATLERPESYSRTLTIESGFSTGSTVYTVGVQVRSGYTKMLITQTGALSKSILVTPTKLYIWYGDGGAYYSGSAGGDAGVLSDEYQMIKTYEDILRLSGGDILSAGYQEYMADSCIVVDTVSPELHYLERCYISVASGLLVGAETYDGDTLIYRQSSSPVSLTVPEESAFLLPDGKNALTLG